MTSGLENVGSNRVIGLSGSALDSLMPMHIWVGAGNFVVRAGPTLTRLAGRSLHERRLDEVLCLSRPRQSHSLDQLLRMQGMQLRVSLTDVPDLPLKGHIVALPGGTGAFLNLSLGISLFEAVKRFDLKLNDFAPSELAVELLYLMEGKAAITGELKRLAQQLNGAREFAENEAATDTLTGLLNRRGFEAALDDLLTSKRRFALMHVDLDHFKQVNDTHGHAAGDRVLATAARILRAQCREKDLVARFGGDEFIVLFVDLVDPDSLLAAAERMIARLEEPIRFSDITCRISGSIGISIADGIVPTDPKRLIHEADVALYASKRRGRGCATVFHNAQEEGETEVPKAG
ncbi:Sensory box/GGDEF family protein [Rhodovulum sp. P5]|uniref:GGDEF domain-containing protein n=1 Tax=Rhodovulum sp. P5 TaxID=1564506 RepID=UPI0009C22330|nr:GGDEF domain-containing protein [Rhodovulum sp. P5]ARE39614.1 Sensory box/GGDEF family protein [Rhodovulum sp. P5]